MNGVLGMAELLMETDLDTRQRELSDIIMSSGSSLVTIINDILDFSKIEAGKFSLTPGDFDLCRAVEDVAALMAGRAIEKNLELMIRYQPDLPQRVIGDGARLRQVITNLIGNAVKFTEQGHVLVEVSGDVVGTDAQVQIAVTDTGCGIAPDKIDLIFEKFEQADTTSSRAYEGTGLGLTISRSIVDLMGGRIEAHSRMGQGSTFTVTLTLPVDETKKNTPNTAPLLKGARVLVVDDNAINRRILFEQLTAVEAEPICCATVAEAFDRLDADWRAGRLPDIIISDYQMPDIDGRAFALSVRARTAFARLPIVMLSSVAEPETEGLDGVEWLVKPVRGAYLAETLSRCLARYSEPPVLAQGRAHGPSEGAVQVVAAGSRPVILIAEDNPVNQLVITKMLAPFNAELLLAENGEAAVSTFIVRRPDLVIMDVSMPLMDGHAATRAIRAHEEAAGWARTPVIGATAHVMEEDRARCRDAGMDDYMSKPIRKDMVCEKVGKWLGREAA